MNQQEWREDPLTTMVRTGMESYASAVRLWMGVLGSCVWWMPALAAASGAQPAFTSQPPSTTST